MTDHTALFARIAAGAVDREENRTLPFDEIDALRRSGFTAGTVPTGFGGSGWSNRQLFAALVDLAVADSNLPQLLRAHFAFVEGLLLQPSDRSEQWLRAAAEGIVFGNASHERSAAQVGQLSTRLHLDGEEWFLDGEKHYSTGSLFADWISVTAQRTVPGASPAADDEHVQVLVPVDAEGVLLRDDWDGFGQRLTGSGSTLFTRVRVDLENVTGGSVDRAATSMPAFVQLVLLASLAGVAGAVVRDAAEFVRSRTRVYAHGSGDSAARDPLVQQVVGRLAADAAAAQALVLDVADRLDEVHERRGDPEAVASAELTAVQAQAVVTELVLRSTTALFDVGGASATSLARHLDRHWRNARVLSSHNPVVYQLRTIGDHVVNGGGLNYFWATGESAAANGS